MPAKDNGLCQHHFGHTFRDFPAITEKINAGLIKPAQVERIPLDESKASAEAREWLERMGIHKPGMTRAEKTEADKAYCRHLLSIKGPNNLQFNKVAADLEIPF